MQEASRENTLHKGKKELGLLDEERRDWGGRNVLEDGKVEGPTGAFSFFILNAMGRSRMTQTVCLVDSSVPRPACWHMVGPQ